MRYTLRSHIGGLGAVRNPFDEDELIPVEDGEIVVDDGELARAIERESGALDLEDETDESDEGDGGDSEDESDDSGSDEIAMDPAEMSVIELHEWAADTGDVEALDAVIASERAGKNRSSAIERLEQRRSAIEDRE